MGNRARTILIESPDHFARDLTVQLAGHDMLKAKGITLIAASAPRSSSAIRPASFARCPALFSPAAQAPGPLHDPNRCIEKAGIGPRKAQPTGHLRSALEGCASRAPEGGEAPPLRSAFSRRAG